jgi:hypothetical protein
MHESRQLRSPWPAVAATVAVMIAASVIAYGANESGPETAGQGSAQQSADLTATSTKVLIGQREVTCDPPPRLREGHVLVPLSFFTDSLGGSVSYDDRARTWTLALGEHSLLIRTWQRHFVLDGRRCEAPWAPEVLEDTVFLPLWILSQSFGLDASFEETAGGGVIACRQLAGTLQGIRCGVDAEKTRVVLDLDLLVPFSWEQEADGSVVVRLPPAPPDRPAKRRLEIVGSRWVQDVRQTQLPDGSIEVRIATTGEVRASFFSLGNPARIVIDIGSAEQRVVEPVVESDETERVPPQPELPSVPVEGVRLEERNFGTAQGAVRVNVLYVDLRHPDVRVQPALAGDIIGHTARPSVIARREGAYAAANGGFFAPRGVPLGMLVINREWISHPMYGRAALGIMEDGRVVIDNVKFNGSAELSGVGTLPLTGMNALHELRPELIAYNRQWGSYVARGQETTHVTIEAPGVIGQVNTGSGETLIPANGWVLSGTGASAAALAKAQPGTLAHVSIATDPPWDGLVHALGAGPMLVKDGRPNVTAQQERFRSDVRLGSAPRTAVGIDADGRLMLVTVDGRSTGSSRRGMTLAELASVMAKLGAKDAMNLDGGSSSTLAVASRVVNKQGTGWERAVPNALLVFANPQASATKVAAGE